MVAPPIGRARSSRYPPTMGDPPKLFRADPPRPPPGPRPRCDCFVFPHRKRQLRSLHAEPQDTSTDAWARVLENVEQARQSSARVLKPLEGLTGDQRSQIVTLPATIGSLTEVQELRLYGSHVVRLPPAIGGMSALRYLDVYTSHRLHFAPYELSRCHGLRDSRVSTRVLYGNYKNRGLFPHLKLPENARGLELSRPKTCSVCDAELGDATPVARWITLRLGTDWWPLLVHACSGACIERLPKPPEGYVDHPHTGGHHVKQPPARY